MENTDRLVVVAAIENLIKGQDTDDNARIIIQAFHHLKSRSIISGSFTGKSESGAFSGMTDAGQASFREEGETEKSFGVQIFRVGKWKVWRSDMKFLFDRKSEICFSSFLSQGINESERDREYFLEYDQQLNPVAFGYAGEPKLLGVLGPISIYTVRPVIVYGKTKKMLHLLITA